MMIARMTAAHGCAVLMAMFAVAGFGVTIAQAQSITAQRDPAAAQPAAAPVSAAQSQPAATAPAAPPRQLSPLEALLKQFDDVQNQLLQARKELAEARLQATQAERELAELRQFMADHHEYGDDFTKYKAVREIAEKESQRKEQEAARAKREAEKAARAAKAAAARAAKNTQDSHALKVAKYRQSGFAPLGLDVFTSKMSFYYESKDSSHTRIDYDPLIGTYLRPVGSTSEVDHSKMTISGSVLNASDEVRNIGVALTFFDDKGNQIGHETVEIKNARPDVPYPFTSKIDMASNRAFSSNSTYVLYADPVDSDAPPAGNGGGGGGGGGAGGGYQKP